MTTFISVSYSHDKLTAWLNGYEINYKFINECNPEKECHVWYDGPHWIIKSELSEEDLALFLLTFSDDDDIGILLRPLTEEEELDFTPMSINLTFS